VIHAIAGEEQGFTGTTVLDDRPVLLDRRVV
jgi:hypothetical protein